SPRMAYTREIEKLKRQWDENPKGTSFAPLAELYRKDGQHDKAMEVLRVGLESNPRHIPGNIVRGRCCLDLKQDAEAEVAFRRALELDPENVIALKALADITERGGRLDEATTWLQQLVSVDPSNDDARDQMTRVSTAMAAPDPEPEPEPEPVVEPEPPVMATTVELIPPSFDEPFTVEARPPAPFSTPSVAAESLGLTPPAPDPFAGGVGTHEAPAASAPMAGFESAEFDSSAGRDLKPQGVPGMLIEHAEEASTEPLIGSGSSAQGANQSGFDVGLEKAEEIVLRGSSATEFQTASASEDMAQGFRVSTSSEFQTASASEDMASAFAAKEAETAAPANPEPVEESVPVAAELTPAVAAQSWSPPEPPAVVVDEPPAAVIDSGTAGAPELVAPEAPAMMPVPEPFVFMAPEEAAAVEPATIANQPEPIHLESAPESLQFDTTPISPEIHAPVVAEMEPSFDATRSGESGGLAQAHAALPDDLKIIYPPGPTQAAEADEPGVGSEPEPVVTETMAELYLRQGLRHEALRVFRQLADRAPGDLHLRERVTQLESDLAAFSAGRRAASGITAAATGGESVGSFFQGLLGSAVGTSGQVAPPAASSVEAMEGKGGGAPTRPAQDSLSLSAIFGEDASPVPPTVSNGSESNSGAASGLSNGGVSFDQFFGDQPASGEMAGANRRASRAGGPDEDLDQFQNW
ncbi:MAG: tetratricopeptide repeat protein, partial [Gemmatimonadota bacterium]